MRFISLSALISLVLLLSACGSSAIDDFSYTDQRGEPVALEDLKGTPWLATFVFTNCNTVCPPMTFNLSGIQEELEADGLSDYKIVAFSVDPIVDTPETLQNYLAQFSVPDDSKWHLLTGYTQDEIAEFAKDNFKSFVRNDPESDQVIHGTNFYLVDQEGVVVNNYDGYDSVPVEDIKNDLRGLIEEY
ncbi:Cytochrome oxidase biogenesis protein Sco1/SenC/PrrC, putative copper metallochaperone [Planococcus halocryophilus Or1]|uniref:Cytochrome c oxidase assembly protein n=1 Tax=Planococcus halocryophilus TaxID=1215089 RepID=A0A1C7DN19_9BACL|nr:SCO family protein [Planococcus halocryophilus]ANU12990.1 cytochrome c oxidase assembly protein [Planococcus halocryophilus]EMF45472.1 Cytochrome oxidase biogenesis protein Sco1/SenC/PrrC, putative copper metallochaperone [Planococcus halocryophilus Or1]